VNAPNGDRGSRGGKKKGRAAQWGGKKRKKNKSNYLEEVRGTAGGSTINDLVKAGGKFIVKPETGKGGQEFENARTKGLGGWGGWRGIAGGRGVSRNEKKKTKKGTQWGERRVNGQYVRSRGGFDKRTATSRSGVFIGGRERKKKVVLKKTRGLVGGDAEGKKTGYLKTWSGQKGKKRKGEMNAGKKKDGGKTG